MKSVKVGQDYKVELPDEVRDQIRPGDSLEVVVRAGNVIYVRPSSAEKSKLGEIIERVRANPSESPVSEAEIEETIHEVRRERKCG